MSYTTALSDPKIEHRFSIEDCDADENKAMLREKGGTVVDAADMARLGRVQELRRNFKFVGIVGFVTILQSTWECTLLSNYFGLFNGGTGGVIWGTIAVWLCMMCMIASMAELASMAPTAGGQYHWVSEFAPPKLQKPLSYVVGWCCCLGWIAGIPACAQQLAGVVQQMILLRFPEANVEGLWQTTLMTFIFIIVTVGFNMLLAHQLPLAEGIILFVHVFGFFAFLLTFWIMGEHKPASEVFFTFQDGGGWNSIGLSCLIGLATPVWCFIGPDAGAHMSEELKDASIQLPKAMLWATFGNGLMGITMIVTFCFCLGDVQDVLESTSLFPVIDVIYRATGSYAGTCVLGSVLVVLMYFMTVTTVASASRQVWAFSRDRGFPLSSWIRTVKPGLDIPLNALIVCLIVSLIMAAINFGSDLAFQAVLSVSNAALLFSYIVSVGCIRLKRLRSEKLLTSPWSLGKWGAPINDITLAFLTVAFVFSFFPLAPLTGTLLENAQGMNWAIVLFGTVCLFALVYYVIRARKTYVAPVTLVKRD